MVIKPAEQTPLSMLALADILREAGLPDGVLNVVTDQRPPGAVMEPLIRDGRARKLSFTGSTAVGRKLLEQCAEKVLRTSMELGGNAPFLVFEDADLDAAVDGAMQAKMRNIGEACTAANRFYVQRGVADEFARAWPSGWPALPVGPRHRGRRRGRSADRRRAAVDEGDRAGRGRGRPRRDACCTAARPSSGAGHFYPPTVLTDVPADAEMRHEEIFGPVAPIAAFDTEDEAVAMANDTEYGLVGYSLHANVEPGAAGLRALRGRHGRPEPGRRVQPGGAVRRGQAVRARPRRRLGRHRGVPRNPLPGHAFLSVLIAVRR